MLIEVKERLDGPEIVSRNAMASDVGKGCGRRALLPDGSGEEEEPLLVQWLQTGLKDWDHFFFFVKKLSSFQVQKRYILIKARQMGVGDTDTDKYTAVACNPSALVLVVLFPSWSTNI